MGLFSKLKEGLTKTRNNIVSGIDSVFSGFSKIDDDFYDELEETLIMGDIGVRATEEIIEDLKEKVKENKIKQPEECKHLLIETIKEKMNPKKIYIEAQTHAIGFYEREGFNICSEEFLEDGIPHKSMELKFDEGLSH